jgi:hypothetical protein
MAREGENCDGAAGPGGAAAVGVLAFFVERARLLLERPAGNCRS